MKKIFLMMAVLVFTFGLVGCGVKGPLYAPSKPAASHVTQNK